MRFPFPFLVILLIFIGISVFFRIRTTKKEQASRQEFLENERRANETRAQDISDLHYIQIPLSYLPFLTTDNSVINSCQDNIRKLANQKILNLTGISNTELKLQYGAPNLEFLSQCDEAFTELCRTLQEWAEALHELGYDEEAACILEYGIGWGSDIKASYLLLADLYFKNGQFSRIDDLIASAETLNSLSKTAIIRALKSL